MQLYNLNKNSFCVDLIDAQNVLATFKKNIELTMVANCASINALMHFRIQLSKIESQIE